MRINTTPAVLIGQCAKPNCGNHGRARHHRGGEHRYLRIMAHKWNTPEYKEFAVRYRAFLPEDVVELCADHHEEIHAIYATKLLGTHRYIRGLGWPYVHKLIDRARKLCDAWIKKETPGVQEHIYTAF